MNIQVLMEKARQYRKAGGRIRDTEDAEILAGDYLDWANGNLDKAIHALQAHCSGQYIDMPPFPGCFAALGCLQALKITV